MCFHFSVFHFWTLKQIWVQFAKKETQVGARSLWSEFCNFEVTQSFAITRPYLPSWHVPEKYWTSYNAAFKLSLKSLVDNLCVLLLTRRTPSFHQIYVCLFACLLVNKQEPLLCVYLQRDGGSGLIRIPSQPIQANQTPSPPSQHLTSSERWDDWVLCLSRKYYHHSVN